VNDAQFVTWLESGSQIVIVGTQMTFDDIPLEPPAPRTVAEAAEASWSMLAAAYDPCGAATWQECHYCPWDECHLGTAATVDPPATSR
jgi:hypothetical protein